MYFWLTQRKNSNIYDFGFKQNIINEKGHIEKINLIIDNSNLILKKDEEIGNYKINNTIYTINNPIEDCNLIKLYNLDLNKLNSNPENIDNKIATFEIKNDILRETYYKFFR
tara:strand:- start:173 stop:508 length:336 start_codon:yes stop_codon:yes gene_type:complete